MELARHRDSAQLDDHSFIGAQLKFGARIFLVTIEMGRE
jgi:hypothetical protein